MTQLDDLIQSGSRIECHGPWPRVVVDRPAWEAAGAALAAGELTLLGLWGETETVHMAVGETGRLAVLSLPCPDRRYPSIGRAHPPALRLERAARDLYGLVPEGSPDTRPWLIHADPYPFLEAEGPGLHQIAVGPVHAGIIEPGHFRFAANGETIVRLEARLGYTHKGVEALMAGATVEAAAQIAGRVSGDSTVAYAWAFVQAVETALGLKSPPRAIQLRALMAELERLANHLNDIGFVCNDAAFGLLHAHFAALREGVLRAADTAFGHRLMRDLIVPGGVSKDLAAPGKEAIAAAVAAIRRQWPLLVEIYDDTASLQDRTVGTGIVKTGLARQDGAGGYVGRAAGRNFDARAAFPYAPYDKLRFDVPVREEGDVDARVRIRIAEAEQSLSLIDQLLAGLPDGPLYAPLPAANGPAEGMALVEAFRGDVLAWVRLNADGTVARCHLRDASWFQWPLVEAAIEGNIVADFPLCNKSFNCAYSGVDL
ncbi:MAG TPA: NADH-quinone oxidoreductase subunit C [Devosiaceae bacterium]|nr:NADH-quinone oxidoreductase subunit C [Devosiaceae bacterium]